MLRIPRFMYANKHFANIFSCLLILSLSISLMSCSKSSSNQSDYDGPMLELLTPEQTGVQVVNKNQEDVNLNYFSYQYIYNGGGVAIGDINNDGLPDLFFTLNMAPNKLYLNKGDMKFEDITKNANFKERQNWSSGVTMADVNGDGWMDIYVCRSGKFEEDARRNQLYINNKDLTFTEKGAEYGLDDPAHSSQASFFDYDKDGDLDLFLINHSVNFNLTTAEYMANVNVRDPLNSNKLYENQNGKYVDVSVKAGLKSNSNDFGLGLVTVDLNEDGWTDIYVTNDYNTPDYLYINNQNGTFTESIQSAIPHISNFAMGCDIADFNNDAFADIMVLDMVAEDNYRIKTNMSGMNPKLFWQAVNNGMHYQYMFNTLQIGNGNGRFSDVAHMADVSNTDWSWAPLFMDMDNDGYKDLFITNGYKRDVRNSDVVKARKEKAKEDGGTIMVNLIDELNNMPSVKIPNYAYRNTGGLRFEKVMKEWGFDQPVNSNGMAYGDLDGDGDLDLVLNNLNEPASIYESHAREIGGNYLRIKLKAKKGSALNTQVKVFHGAQMQYQELTLTRGYQSAVEPVLHFGMNESEQAERIVVRWPDGSTEEFKNIESNQVITLEQKATTPSIDFYPKTDKLFSSVNLIDFEHRENEFDDFEREVLLPHKMSQFGPGMAVADVNGDKLEDIFIGGASGQSAELKLQQEGGKFISAPSQPWKSELSQEDMGALFFDADNDGDMDLYVSSGGNEGNENDSRFQDRLYLNNGSGSFSKGKLPKLTSSTSCVVAADFDQDNDMDLFVGGRQVPGKYPQPPQSYLLQNDGKGNFTDIASEAAPDLQRVGMVTTALWTDFDNDNDADLMIAGEWMAVRFYENDGGKLSDMTMEWGLENETGWWNSLTAADFDGDGDMDYVAGNLGLNYKYQASKDAPFDVYSYDFDESGSLDIVLAYRNDVDDGHYPLRGRQCSSEQVPDIKKKFPTYEAFGSASLREVYGENLDKALHYEAKNFASCYIENQGEGKFVFRQLPERAQISPLFGLIPYDFDADGKLDLLTCGNMFHAEVETQRADAGVGLLLKGDGKGGFSTVSPYESGFKAGFDAKGMVLLPVNDMMMVVVANNNSKTQTFRLKYPGTILSRAKPDETTAILMQKDGTQTKMEFHSAYLNQSAQFVPLNPKLQEIIFRSSVGKERRVKVY